MTVSGGVDAYALLSDAGIVRIRTVRSDDERALQAMYKRVSGDTLYLRFFTVSPYQASEDVQRLTRPADVNHHSLVAEIRGEIIGVATYERLADPAEAEVAFLVDDAHQGRGVGMLLLEHLATIATVNGVVSFVAETLPANARMLHVFAEAGFPAQTTLTTDVVQVTIPLRFDEEFRRAVDMREANADAASLTRVLAPDAVAVVGAGSDPRGLGHLVLANMVRRGYRGDLYAVNRSGYRVADVQTFPDLQSIPGSVDVVVVAVPAADALTVAKEAATRRVAGLVVIAAGFAEVGSEGLHRQAELVRICRDSGMRLIGPNCMGIANTSAAVALNATFSPASVTPGGIGLMSQSGAVGIAAFDFAARSGVGLSTFVSAGNKADVSGNDLLCFWEQDPSTSVCALYLESFGNPRKFARIATRVSRRKPIVVVKSARSISRNRGISPHASIAAASDLAVDTLFDQAGVVRVESLPELFDVATLFDLAALPRGDRVAIVGNSGGPGVLTADACESAGLTVARLTSSTRQRLAQLLPPGVAVDDPVDLPAAADRGSFEAALRVLLDDPDIDSVIAVYAPIQPGADADIGTAIAVVHAERPDKPLLVCFLGRSEVPMELRSSAGRSVVPFYPFPEQAARSLAAATRYAQWRMRPQGVDPDFAGIDLASARAIVRTALGRAPQGAWLDVESAVALMASHGIEVVEVAPVGVEAVLGVVSNPTFGSLVMVGAGGVASDLLADRAFHMLPMTVDDAHRQIRSLRAAPLLFGYHDAPGCDLEALEEMMLRTAQLAVNVPELVELDLSPVVVSSSGAVAVNVRARLQPLTGADPLSRRLR